MQQHEIHDYLKRFFTASHCELMKEERHVLQVRLTTELDKQLMNRPFYWHYLESTGRKPEPMTLTFVTEKKETNKRDEEFIHFGSPRLHQILCLAQQLGHSILLYEKSELTDTKVHSLQPWLCQNVKISFQSDRKKDFILSFGLNLIHGKMVTNFFQAIRSFSFATKIPDYAFTLSPLITPKSGLLRIENVIRQWISTEDDTWSVEAKKRWDDDLALLEQFYEEYDERPKSYYIEKEALQRQYEPKIYVETINGGLFYLSEHAFTHDEKTDVNK